MYNAKRKLLQSRFILWCVFSIALSFGFSGLYSNALAQSISQTVLSQEIDSTLDTGSSNAEYVQTLSISPDASSTINGVMLHIKFTLNTADINRTGAFFAQVGDNSGNTCIFEDNEYWAVGSYDTVLTLDTLYSTSGNGCNISSFTNYSLIITRQTGSIPVSFQLYGSPVYNGFASSTYTPNPPLPYTSVYNIFFRIFGQPTQIGTIDPYAVGIATTTTATFCNSSFATTSSILESVGSSIAMGFCNVGVFLFIPNSASISGFTNSRNTLSSKAPLSWIVNIRTLLGAYQASSTENFINLTINFGTTTQALGITSLTIISTSTISKYMPDSTRQQARSLIGAVFWIIAILFMYRQLQHMWNKK